METGLHTYEVGGRESSGSDDGAGFEWRLRRRRELSAAGSGGVWSEIRGRPQQVHLRRGPVECQAPKLSQVGLSRLQLLNWIFRNPILIDQTNQNHRSLGPAHPPPSPVRSQPPTPTGVTRG